MSNISKEAIAETLELDKRRTQGTWSWINSKWSEARAGRLFGEGSLVLDSPDFIYCSTDDAQFVMAAPKAAQQVRELDALVEFFDNKIYILERAPKDELSDRYRVEITKLRKAIKQARGE
jgi:hypothetical protein